MESWIPVFVLPNVAIERSIGCDLAVLVPVHDQRIECIATTHRLFGDFLSSFTDPFGRKIDPSVLLVSAAAPNAVLTANALSSFRDLIAMSVVPRTRSLNQSYSHQNRGLWADYFDVYPWMISKDYTDLVGHTPALLGLDETSKFRGQSSPRLFQTSLAHSDVDMPILSSLLDRWKCLVATDEPSWSDTALFRSLNMAFRAAELPAGTEITLYDVGRSLALWVSAFEILAHPGQGGSANLAAVYKLLEKAPWHLAASKAENFAAYKGRNRQRVKMSNGCWIYGELYHARNDFIHGNPIRDDRLIIKGSEQNLFSFAAPLYRMALAAFLQVYWSKAVPELENADEFAQYIADHSEFMGYQKTVEEALLLASKPKRA